MSTGAVWVVISYAVVGTAVGMIAHHHRGDRRLAVAVGALWPGLVVLGVPALVVNAAVLVPGAWLVRRVVVLVRRPRIPRAVALRRR